MEWGFGLGSGPSRGDPYTRAFRPIEASKVAIRNGCFTSTPAVRRRNQAESVKSHRTGPRSSLANALIENMILVLPGVPENANRDLSQFED